MALFTETQQDYYEGNNYGNYQLVSIRDIINQFMMAYVGEEKIISKARRTDVAFHAKRALAELSFDTFKSIKSQEIELPASLTMILPHDYVNYTKLSWSDSAGIKHPLYPTKHTSNPFKIKQNNDGEYDFVATSGIISSDDLSNTDFSSALSATNNWVFTPAVDNTPWGGSDTDTVQAASPAGITGGSSTRLQIDSKPFTSSQNSVITGRAYAVWQEINVANMDSLDIRAYGSAAGTVSGAGDSTIRFGISSTPGDQSTNLEKNNPSLNDTVSNPGDSNAPNFLPTSANNGTGGRAYVEWVGTGATATQKEVLDIDVSNYNVVYVLITCFTPFTSLTTSNRRCTLTDVEVTYEGASPDLVRDGDSATWSNYKSQQPSELVQQDYRESFDLPFHRERYGLQPSHAQTNGSFYIDELKGLIHFSSNISGKTVILDYISDSLGTWQEMQVHKLAEDAMYKWIMHAVLSTRANTPEYIIKRYQKEKFAAVRKAKLRLSNIKIEELTQILRDKSKWIKH
tara:strand:+ start:912 stop:2453 length:1542 start_codon:yes stop_codon:yes gene_type:complete